MAKDMEPPVRHESSNAEESPSVCTDRTVEEEVEEMMGSMESMILPRPLEPPDSWKRIAAWLRVRFSHRAVRPH